MVLLGSIPEPEVEVVLEFTNLESMYVVPTGRVVVPTGRYVVTAGKVIIIVSPGRLRLVPTGRILSLSVESILAHSDPTLLNNNKIVNLKSLPTVSNNNAKFPYLKKDEYEEAEGIAQMYGQDAKFKDQLNQLKAKPEDEDINLKFLRALPSSWSQTGSHRSGNVIEDVLQSFVADTEPEQQLAYEDLNR
ncbi:hypothetical protein Tco_0766374 [Tanacetum coccineum]